MNDFINDVLENYPGLPNCYVMIVPDGDWGVEVEVDPGIIGGVYWVKTREQAEKAREGIESLLAARGVKVYTTQEDWENRS